MNARKPIQRANGTLRDIWLRDHPGKTPVDYERVGNKEYGEWLDCVMARSRSWVDWQSLGEAAARVVENIDPNKSGDAS